MNVIKEAHLHTPHLSVVHMSYTFLQFIHQTHIAKWKPSNIVGQCQMRLKSKYDWDQIDCDLNM